MKINLKIKPYKKLNQLIEQHLTGSAEECARKIGVSRATLFNMLDEIRGAGIAVEYNGIVKSYTYKNNKRLKINQPIEVIEV